MKASVVISAALAIGLVGCGTSKISPLATVPTTPSPSPSPIGVDLQASDFALKLVMPKTIWTTEEPIGGLATLGFGGAASITIGSSGAGPVTFEITEVGGPRHIQQGQALDCKPTVLSATTALQVPLFKSGSADSSFAETFLADPIFRLPRGDWDVTARAAFWLRGCSAPAIELQKTTRIHVKEPLAKDLATCAADQIDASIDGTSVAELAAYATVVVRLRRGMPCTLHLWPWVGINDRVGTVIEQATWASVDANLYRLSTSLIFDLIWSSQCEVTFARPLTAKVAFVDLDHQTAMRLPDSFAPAGCSGLIPGLSVEPGFSLDSGPTGAELPSDA